MPEGGAAAGAGTDPETWKRGSSEYEWTGTSPRPRAKSTLARFFTMFLVTTRLLSDQRRSKIIEVPTDNQELVKRVRDSRIIKVFHVSFFRLCVAIMAHAFSNTQEVFEYQKTSEKSGHQRLRIE